MLVLDTDHVSLLGRGGAVAEALEGRLASSGRQVAMTIVTAEERLRGRLAQVSRAREQLRLIAAYGRLHETLSDLKNWLILPWTAEAAAVYERLRALKLGIGTMDLRIAGIVIAVGGLLLTRNLRDFALLPQLSVEDWLP